jgi:hypothetical protein
MHHVVSQVTICCRNAFPSISNQCRFLEDTTHWRWSFLLSGIRWKHCLTFYLVIIFLPKLKSEFILVYTLYYFGSQTRAIILYFSLWAFWPAIGFSCLEGLGNKGREGGLEMMTQWSLDVFCCSLGINFTWLIDSLCSSWTGSAYRSMWIKRIK